MIKVSDVQLYGNEEAYVLQALRAREIAQGEFLSRFERKFASRVNAKHAIAVSSGTAALHLALRAAEVHPGDHVVLPVLTYVATANAVRYCGATPIYADVSRTTWCLDAVSAEQVIDERTTAILPVGLYGHWYDVAALANLALRWNSVVVEDAAEALGSYWHGAHAGTFGLVGAFSLFGNKVITCGEGGVVVTNDDEVAQRVRLLRGQGSPLAIGEDCHRYFHSELGYNYRLTNLQAAFALGQLEMITFILHQRERVLEFYRKHITLEHQVSPAWAHVGPWMFACLVPRGVDRDRVMQTLAQHGVETRPVFLPMTKLPADLMYGVPSGRFPVAEDISARGICLPTHPGLTESDLSQVVETLSQALEACYV
jgi:perosamine synthetase